MAPEASPRSDNRAWAKCCTRSSGDMRVSVLPLRAIEAFSLSGHGSAGVCGNDDDMAGIPVANLGDQSGGAVSAEACGRLVEAAGAAHEVVDRSGGEQVARRSLRVDT